MPSELINKLLKKEKEEKNINNLKQIILSQHDINEIFKNYNCIKYYEDFYDSDPPECDTCNKYINCGNCDIYKEWKYGSKLEERLSYNNWVDIFGPGLWDETQKSINEYVKNIFEKNFIDNNDNCDRQFYYIDEENHLCFIWFRRDIPTCSDEYWFIFERKAGA